MAQIEKRGLQGNSVDGSKVQFSNNESFRARNFADTSDVSLFKLNASDEWEFQALPKYSSSNIATESFVTGELANYVLTSAVGAASGICPLNGSTKIDSTYLPSYVDDVEEYADFANLPVTGETGKIYVTLDTNKTYRWSGSAYVEISAGPSSTDAVPEGSLNLYFTDARAKTAAVVDSMAGSETDQAPSVSSVKTFIENQSADINVQTFTLSAGDVSNGYIDLAFEAEDVIEVTPKGFPPQHPGDDYTLSVVSSVTRLTFAGDMLSLIAGDKLKVAYSI
jgi:hypothetical protein